METFKTECQTPGDFQGFLPRGGGGAGDRDWGRAGGRVLGGGCRAAGGARVQLISREHGDRAFGAFGTFGAFGAFGGGSRLPWERGDIERM